MKIRIVIYSVAAAIILVILLPYFYVYRTYLPEEEKFTINESNIVKNKLYSPPTLFVPCAHYSLEKVPKKVAIGDINNDGKNEVVILTKNGKKTGSRLYVFTQSDFGKLEAPLQYYELDRDIVSLVIEDIIGDEKAEIITSNNSNNEVNIFNIQPLGNMLLVESFIVTNHKKIWLGDMNGDGIDEIVVLNTGNLPAYLTAVIFERNNGKYISNDSIDYRFELGDEESINGITIGDINSDGRTEFVVAHSNKEYSTLSILDTYYLITIKKLKLALHNSSQVLYQKSIPLAVADVDLDGRNDIIVIYENKLLVYIQDQDEEFHEPRQDWGRYHGKGINIIKNEFALGDVNGDKQKEMVIAEGTLQELIIAEGNLRFMTEDIQGGNLDILCRTQQQHAGSPITPTDNIPKKTISEKSQEKEIITVKVQTENVLVLKGEFLYRPSKIDDKKSFKIITIEKIKRLFFEKMGALLEEIPKARELGITADQITTSLAGMFNVEVVDEQYSEEGYFGVVQIGGNTDNIIEHFVRDSLNNRDLEKTRQIAEEALKGIEQLKNESYLSGRGFDNQKHDEYKKFIQELIMAQSYEEGRIRQLYGQNRMAIDAYDYAIKLNPNFAYAYFYRGVAYCSYNNERPGTLAFVIDCDKAVKDFNKAIELEPNNAYFYFRRGIAHKQKNVVQAIEDFNKALELNPYNEQAYIQRGDLYLDLSEYQKAIKDCYKAIELNSENYSTYNLRGVAYQRFGNPYKAISDFTKAIEFAPQNATLNISRIYYNRGTSYEALGDYEKAHDDLTKAIGLAPRFREARKRREQIRQKLSYPFSSP